MEILTDLENVNIKLSVEEIKAIQVGLSSLKRLFETDDRLTDDLILRDEVFGGSIHQVTCAFDGLVKDLRLISEEHEKET